jgi:DNA replication protein DnaC
MIDEYLNSIQEGYVLSGKTISVNLSEFQSGRKKKLLIIGVLGSGKTSLGQYLKEKYNVPYFFSDTAGLEQALKSPKRMVIETIEIASLYMERPEYRKLILSMSMIIIGLSALVAGLRADKRDGTVLGQVKDKKDMYISTRDNLTYFQKRLKYLRKDVITLPNADIKEFEIPKFKPVYY